VAGLWKAKDLLLTVAYDDKNFAPRLVPGFCEERYRVYGKALGTRL